MTKNTQKGLAQRLRDGQTLIGTLISLYSADITELLAKTGFDWLFIDAEHGAFMPEQAKHMLQAAWPVPCLIRIPCADEIWVKKALDIGADGIIVPQVNSATDVEQIMRWAKYAPQGARGIGIGRAHEYGHRFEEYLQCANENTVVVIQAETRQAIENIDAITAVAGIDAILIGPYDLSSSLGKPGLINDKLVIDSIHKVRDICLAKQIPLGIFGVSAEAVKPWMEQGFTLITAGVDTAFMIQAATRTLQALRSD